MTVSGEVCRRRIAPLIKALFRKGTTTLRAAGRTQAAFVDPRTPVFGLVPVLGTPPHAAQARLGRFGGCGFVTNRFGNQEG